MQVGTCTLYYPQGLQKIADYAGYVLQTDVMDIENLLDHTPQYDVPVIVYRSHPEFLETNVLPFILPEGVGGFTEFIKGRVAIPNTGSYGDLRHVLIHEMTHAIVRDKIRRENELHRKLRTPGIPLWFHEGLSEYTSTPWTIREEMILSDVYLDGSLPDIANLWRTNGSYLVYCAGHSLLLFMTETFGRSIVSDILETIWDSDDFDDALRTVTGLDMRTMTFAWRDWLGRKFSYLNSREEAELRYSRITRHRESFLAPSITGSKTDTVYALSYGDGYTSIYAIDPGPGPRRVRKLVKAGGSEGLESLHLFRSRIGTGPDNTIAFVAKAGERDALYIMDGRTGEFKHSWTFDSLIGLSSPALSADGRYIAMSAVDSMGIADLYMIETSSGELHRLTEDVYFDASPCFSPSSNQLVFSSDRSQYGLDGFRNLFVLDIPSKEISQLTFGRYVDSYPAWRPGSEDIAFVSDRGDGVEIWVTDGARIGTVIAVKGGATDPAWNRDGSRLYFSVYRHRRYAIFSTPYTGNDTSTRLVNREGEGGFWTEPVPRFEHSPRSYSPRYSLDLSRSVVAYDPVASVGGGAEILLTDILGDHRLYFHLSNSAETIDDFIGSFNLAATYVNLRHRLNYGIGVFRLPVASEMLYNGYQAAERHNGTALSVSYPLSRFHRLEGGTSVRWVEELDTETNWVELGGNIGYVRDTALWGSEGPWDGSRISAQLSMGTGGSTRSSFRRELFLDLRKYIRLTLRSTFALRGQYWISDGDRPKRFGLGGSLSLRGWTRNRMVGRHRLLFNSELRFPLLDAIVFYTTVGDIGFGPLRGALFADVGRAWNDSFPGFVGSVGGGLRLTIGGLLVLRLDMAAPFDFESFKGRPNTQFYFGWSY